MYNSPAWIGHPVLALAEEIKLHPIDRSSNDNFGKIHQGPLTLGTICFEAVPAIKAISNWMTVPNVTEQLSESSQKLTRIFSGKGAPELPFYLHRKKIRKIIA